MEIKSEYYFDYYIGYLYSKLWKPIAGYQIYNTILCLFFFMKVQKIPFLNICLIIVPNLVLHFILICWLLLSIYVAWKNREHVFDIGFIIVFIIFEILTTILIIMHRYYDYLSLGMNLLFAFSQASYIILLIFLVFGCSVMIYLRTCSKRENDKTLLV